VWIEGLLQLGGRLRDPFIAIPFAREARCDVLQRAHEFLLSLQFSPQEGSRSLPRHNPLDLFPSS